MATKYLRKAAKSVAQPTQTEQADERQVKNSAGGYVYPVTDWVRLDRFLILGSEGGSYYATERKLTVENIEAVKRCTQEDGIRVVKRIVEISDAGRAPKNDPALLALAYVAGKGNREARAYALEQLPKVARIGTHLFHFADFVQQFRGWGRGLRDGIGRWYEEKDVERLADQVTKYQQRDGWGHRDLLRLSHPKLSKEKQPIAQWVVKGTLAENLPERVRGHVELQATKDAKTAASLIRRFGLVRESVPTELLGEKLVWEALSERMPMTAMIRNLGNLSKHGIVAPMSDGAKRVVAALGDTEQLRKARVHPIQILIAQRTYACGHGLRGSGTWTAVPQVIDALDAAYYETFKFVEPTGKRFYLGMDISGSMFSGEVAGVPNFTPAEASAAMAMVTVRTEPEYYAAGFTTGTGSGGGGMWARNSVMTPMSLSPKKRLDDAVAEMDRLSAKMGGTDCSLPMKDALAQNLKVDVFVVYTDSETWAGDVHASKMLQKYRDKTGIPAKMVVCGMVANGFTIADPEDGGMLDVVGFDTNTPAVVSDFVRGQIGG